jgi:quercetin dioxygenase-like cupin family protein
VSSGRRFKACRDVSFECVLVLDPGGAIAMHKQIDRPEVIYILQGAITEYQKGNVIQRNSGDTWTAGKEATHGVQNTGT